MKFKGQFHKITQVPYLMILVGFKKYIQVKIVIKKYYCQYFTTK